MTPDKHKINSIFVMPKISNKLILLLIFLIILIAYCACGNIQYADSKWYLPTTVSIIRERNANLDEYQKIIENNDYRIIKVDGHFYNFFPIGTPVLITPLVFIINKFYPTNLYETIINKPKITFVLELFLASFIAALTAVFIYLIANFILKNRIYSLLITFIFAFCTSSWSTASRALWTHGPTMLILAIILYLLLLAPKKPGVFWGIGPLLAFSYIIRPSNIISIFFLAIFIFIQYRQYFLRFLVSFSLIFILFLFYNLSNFHSLIPSYDTNVNLWTGSNFLEGLAGTLVSPSRGLLIFSPILLFSILGIIIKIRERKFEKLDYFLLIIIISHWLLISYFMDWWAGHCFGPRRFTDILPYFIYFLIPILPYLKKIKYEQKIILIAIFLVFSIISFLINYRGATAPGALKWNATLSTHPKSGLWDWHDLQFLR